MHNIDAVFAKWLLTVLARTLLKLVTFDTGFYYYHYYHLQLVTFFKAIKRFFNVQHLWEQVGT